MVVGTLSEDDDDDDDVDDDDDDDVDDDDDDDDDDDGSENDGKKMNLRSFKLNRFYLDLLNMSYAGDFSWS